MKGRIFICAFIAAFAVFAAANTSSAGVLRLKAEGVSARTDDEAAVKKAALDDAFKKAVEAAVRSLTGANAFNDVVAQKLEASIYPNTKKYVATYRMLATGWITDLTGAGAAEAARPVQGPVVSQSTETYHVWIEASVDTKSLASDITAATGMEMAPEAEVKVVMLGFDEYAAFDSVKGALQSLGGASSVAYGTFSNGRAVITASVPGGAETLYARLSAGLDKRFVVAPGGPGEVIIKDERR